MSKFQLAIGGQSGNAKNVPPSQQSLKQTAERVYITEQNEAQWWQFGLTTWLLIFGLLLLNVAAFFSPDERSLRLLLWTFDYHHWPTWYAVNLWIATVGIFLSLAFETDLLQRLLRRIHASRFWRKGVTRFKQSQLNQKIVRFFLQRKIGKLALRKWIAFWRGVKIEFWPRYALIFTVLGILTVTFLSSDMFAMPRYHIWRIHHISFHLLHKYIYVPYYFLPMSNYICEGTLSWKILIAPATGLLLIVGLLRWNQKIKKKQRENHAKRSL